MSTIKVLLIADVPSNVRAELPARFPQVEFLEGQEPAPRDALLAQATITYGLPPLERLGAMPALRWIQLISAGVPQELCPLAQQHQVQVTNLAGLYGPSIAEHALGLMTILARNLQVALRQQAERRWERSLARTMTDLQEKTLAIVGLGNIGQSIARLGKAYGMRVLGCRRTGKPTPHVDRLYPLTELHAMLAEADIVAVAAPLTRHTEGMLGAAEFRAMKRGVMYINVSRGPIAEEATLVEALRSGHVGSAGLDVFATEPLPPDHPLWTMPRVVLTPHYSGETINLSDRPARRFVRNLSAWLDGQPLEGRVDLEWGY